MRERIAVSRPSRTRQKNVDAPRELIGLASVGSNRDRFEREANRAAALAAQGRRAALAEHESDTLRLAPADEATESSESSDMFSDDTPVSEAESPVSEEAPAEAPAETPENLESPETAVGPMLLVDDTAEDVQPEQMRKSEFLNLLRPAVCDAVDQALAGTGRDSSGCPQVQFWFARLADRDAAYLERSIRRYAPETQGVTSAHEYIPLIVGRVRASAEAWAASGEVEGVPEEFSADAGAGEGGQDSGSDVQFKSRRGRSKPPEDPEALREELGEGQPLDGIVRPAMESAYGISFGHVRVHTDDTAERLTNRFDARAFTVGEHVAFAADEYQPGTLVGDALIAHELAHVVQQGHGGVRSNTGDDGALEQEADLAAVQATFGTSPAAVRRLGGLRLQRCVQTGGGISPSAFNFEQVTGGGDPNDRSLPWYAACVNITLSHLGATPRLNICQFEVGFPGVHRLGRTSTGEAQNLTAEAFDECVPALLRRRSATCGAIATCVQRRMQVRIPGVRVNSPCLTKMLTPTDWPTRH